MNNKEKEIEDIRNLIKFYEGLGQTNPQLSIYISKLYEELDRLLKENN